jgi:hypothetical protein
VGGEFEGDIAKFMPGVSLPPELSLVNGKLLFSGDGKFTGVAGIDVESKSTKYPLKYIKKTMKV